MVAVKGIFDGRVIQLLEKVEAKPNARVVVTFMDDDVVEDGLRDMVASPNDFDFWNDPREDVYQDFMAKEKDGNG